MLKLWSLPSEFIARHKINLTRRALIGLGGLALIVAPVQAHAQSIVLNQWIPDGPVYATATLADTLYFGGLFSRVQPLTGGGVPIDLTTGLAAAGFPRVHGKVFAAIPDGSGGWYIGGSFDSVGTAPRANIARILSNLSVSSWAPQFDDAVYSLNLSATTLYVGGVFQNINGTPKPWLAALTTTTGALTSWDCPIDGPVYTMKLDGSDLYIGGIFFTIGTDFRSYLTSVSTSTGAASNWDPEPDGFVWSIAISSGTVYVGGSFTSMGLTFIPRNGVAAFSTSSGNLASWDPNVTGTVYTLLVNGSTVYLGGSFSKVGTSTRNNLAAVTTGGTVSSWNPNMGGLVLTLTLNGTNVLAGGDFTTAGSQDRLHLASIDGSTGSVQAWDPATDDEVSCLAVSGTRAYAGGGFIAAGGVRRRNLAALNLTTGQPTPWNPGPDQTVNALTVGYSGSSFAVYVGGDFTTIGSTARPHLAKVNLGGGGASSTWDAGVDGSVRTLALSGDTLYAGGAFNHFGGAARSRLGAVRLATAVATGWVPAVNGLPNTILVGAGGIFVGGEFTTPKLHVAKFDKLGAVQAWTANADSVVYALGIIGNNLYVGGGFVNIAGQPRSRLAAVNAQTGALASWNPSANGAVRAFATANGGIFVGGSFSNIGGFTRRGAAAFDRVEGGGEVLAWDPQVVGDVATLVSYGEQTVMGGSFGFVGGMIHANLVTVGAGKRPVADVPGAEVSRLAFGPVSPNPMRWYGRARFTLPQATPVSLALFDLAGRRARQIIDRAMLQPGEHEATIARAGLQPGVYFLRLDAGKLSATNRVVIIE